MELFDGVPELHLDAAVLDLLDGFLVGAEDVSSMDEGDVIGDIEEIESPVEGAIATADDGDLFAFEDGFVADAIVDALILELFFSEGADFGGVERAGSGGDDDGSGGQLLAAFGFDDVAFAGGDELRGGFFEGEMGAELDALLDHLVGEIFGEDFVKSGNVVDVLFGIESRELAAELGEGVDDSDRHPSQACVEAGEQAAGSASYDRNVNSLQMLIFSTYQMRGG